METSKTKQDVILSVIGLKRHMVWQEPHFSVYDSSKFIRYVPSDYIGSERTEADEIYRMSEFALIHISTGLRITYLTSESYDGETVDYNMKEIFIITITGERLEVIDVDFRKELFFTPDDSIPFADVSMLI